MQPEIPVQRNERISALLDEWSKLAHHRWSHEAEEQRYEALKAKFLALIADGKWVSGRADLLGVIRRDSKELDHSAAVGWLLTPTGRHGMGAGFLRALLGHVWPEDDWAADRAVTVSLEVDRTRMVGDELVQARADIVVHHPTATVVIENKVDAPEGARQCERLYQMWAADEAEVRWLFLTPRGRRPVTVHSPEARAAWRTISYYELANLLERTIPTSRSALGKDSALQYLATLRHRYPGRHR